MRCARENHPGLRVMVETRAQIVPLLAVCAMKKTKLTAARGIGIPEAPVAWIRRR